MSKQELGITKLPITLPDGETIGQEKGFMIVSPPADESLRRIRAKKPFSSKRIAIIEESHYLSMAECEAYAKLFAAAPELLAALERTLLSLEADIACGIPYPHTSEIYGSVNAARAAIAKAKA